MKPAVFFDRDDTLTKGANPGEYITTPDQLELLPGAAKAIRKLNEANVPVFVVTNQPQVAKGLSSVEDIEMINQMFREMLAAEGATMTAIEFCPHHPQGVVAEYSKACQCRKPDPGMLHKLAAAHQIDLSRSFMVGDFLWDIETGKRAGCQTILVKTRDEATIERSIKEGKPDYVAEDLPGAAEWILAHAFAKTRV